MLDCLIIGDSIAKGIGHVRTECVILAQGGINSRDFNDIYRKQIKPAKITIISLGSNDFAKLNTEVELVALRSSIRDGKVFWILPENKIQKKQIVEQVARSFGDTFVTIPELSSDQVHPTRRGYKQLGDLTK